MVKLYIGLDGGGTKTHTVCMTEDGTILGEKLTGCTNVNSVGREEAFNNFKDALEGVLVNTCASKLDVVSVCLGMAGVSCPEDQAERLNWITQIFPNQPLKTQLQNDGIIALVSGTKKLQGIVVISGTGSIVVAINNGQQYRVGGWGAILGDEGSGFALGQGLLQAVATAEDGGPPTALTGLVLQHLNLNTPWELIAWTYRDVSWARFAALSQLVFSAAKDGDKVAQNILEKNVDGLVEHIKLIYKKAGFVGKTEIVFSGGNLTHNDGQNLYAQMLKERIEKEITDIQILFPSVSAHVAAGLLAIQNS